MNVPRWGPWCNNGILNCANRNPKITPRFVRMFSAAQANQYKYQPLESSHISIFSFAHHSKYTTFSRVPNYVIWVWYRVLQRATKLSYAFKEGIVLVCSHSSPDNSEANFKGITYHRRWSRLWQYPKWRPQFWISHSALTVIIGSNIVVKLVK